MFQVSVDEVFAAGHALRGYRGKCENLHGHNYKIRVTLAGESLDHIGLLYDFKDLKEAIQSTIRKLDHRFINEIPPFDVLNPSAENLAKYFYEETIRLLSSQSKTNGKTPNPGSPEGGLHVSFVTVWETDTTTATYFEGGAPGPNSGAI